MTKAEFYKLFQVELEIVFLQAGFKLKKKRGTPIYYSRQKNGIEEGISIDFDRLGVDWNIYLEKSTNDPRIVQLRRLSNTRANPWWSYYDEEALIKDLKEAKEIFRNEGLQWFEGKINYWDMLEKGEK